MASLKSLALTTLPQIQADPVMDRRNRTIAHLEEQKRLLQDPELYANHQGLDRKGRRTAADRKETARLPVVENSSKRIGCFDHPRRSEAD